MKKNILIIVGVIVLVLVVGAGGFWGGMTYQNNQNNQSQARFFQQRGGFPAGGDVTGGSFEINGTPMPGGGPMTFDQSQGNFRGGGTMGQVKSMDGNVLQLSTAQDVTTVNLTGDTIIIKSVEGTVSELQPGTRVMVVGERDDQGNITASQITIESDDTPAMPTRTAP
jgi:hypothetical protein